MTSSHTYFLIVLLIVHDVYILVKISRSIDTCQHIGGNRKLSVTAAAVSQNVRSGSRIYDYGTILDEEGDIRNSDDWSIEDRERNSCVDWCNSAFRNGISTFPSDADDPQPMVVFNDKLFSDDVLAETSLSVLEQVPVLALQICTDEGFVPPWTVRRQVCSDSLEQRHSGISIDILLFGDINLLLDS